MKNFLKEFKIRNYLPDKKFVVVVLFSIALLVLIGLSVSFLINIRENNLKKGIDIQVKYDPDGCELNLFKNDIKITKSKMIEILDKAPNNLDKTELIRGFVLKGYEVEGINPLFVKDTFKFEQAIFVTIKNNTNKTLEKIEYSVGVNRIGHSTDISPYDFKYLESDKILKPNEETHFCITKALKDIDLEFIKSPEKFEFFITYKDPMFLK